MGFLLLKSRPCPLLWRKTSKSDCHILFSPVCEFIALSSLGLSFFPARCRQAAGMR